jgi:prepilin peptidase CpaA
MAEYISIGVALAVCITAVVTDVRSLKIYNWLTLPALASGLIWQVATRGFDGLLDGVTGVLVAFAVLLIPFVTGAMGAGDVKLMSALGAWVGVSFASQIVLVACLLTGAASLIVLLRRGGLQSAWLNVRIAWFRILTLKNHLVMDQPDELRSMKEDKDRRDDLIPFSIMLLLAVFLVSLVHFQRESVVTSLHFLLIK